jgi:hypothetical protein
MAKIKQTIEYPAVIPNSVARQIIEDPSRIASPDGWGKYSPSSEAVKCSERFYHISGSMDNESDPHFVDISIKLPGFCKRALSKVTKKEPNAIMSIGVDPVPDWILEQRKEEQKILIMEWAGKSAVGDVVGEII